ncbi:MAG: patatin-like phospholipase family protein [Bacteroidetes bacterium]|nr:patatin-like phospholipase family protein [Bacteroidota bacterium]
MNLLEKLSAPGPKRILALDGGGIKGALTLGFLNRIETILRKKHHNENMVLSNYFDFIGGTSTGSIIAALLAIGHSTEYITKLYRELGGEIFKDDRPVIGGLFVPKFKSKNLKERLKKEFGDMTLESDKILTGLCILTKRIDTGGTWPIINHPKAKYFKDNKDILLRDAVRASTAAPSYFEPERLQVKLDQAGDFIYSGISMANNPALYMFMVSQLKGFPFHWNTGKENLLIVSVGTGGTRARFPLDKLDIVDKVVKAKHWAVSSIELLMSDAHIFNQMMLQSLGYSPTRISIDREIGNMELDCITTNPLFTYLRYDMPFDPVIIAQHPTVAEYINKSKIDVFDLRKMDKAKNREVLGAIGEIAADEQVKADHFSDSFNI